MISEQQAENQPNAYLPVKQATVGETKKDEEQEEVAGESSEVD
jgi:hypothetical protein